MAPKIPSVVSCSSASLLEYELGDVRAGLELVETEDSWDKICNAILRLKAITIGSADDYPTQLIAACKGLVRPIINSLNSERSRLSGAATDLLTTLATHLQRPFETLIPHFVPALLTLASRSNKVFIARAKATLMAIVEHCQSPLILPQLRHSINDKSASLRLTAIDLTVACLNCFNPPDLEAPNRAEDIEAIIRATARDANADVRKSSRKAFEAYKILFPSRVASFISPLTPTMRKYLDIKGTTAHQPKPLSSSSSAPSVPSATQPFGVLSRSQPTVPAHAKSAGATTVPSVPSAATTFTRVEKPTRAASKPPSSGPSSVSAPTAPPADSVLMPPPPPPQKKSSSGPVRPPLAMQQAIAAAASSRPKLGRLASRPNLKTSCSVATDISKSQPASSHSGAQRPEKAAAPPHVPPSSEPAQPVPQPPPSEEPTRTRTTTRPRRVPKVEAVPITTSGPFVESVSSHTQAEETQGGSAKDKGKEKERPTFAPSTSSAYAEVHAPSRPPSRLAPSTAVQTGGDEELMRQQERIKRRELKEKEKGTRNRTESRPEEAFRPRPASCVEVSHKRVDSHDHDQESRQRPASRMDERQPIFRPPSRAESKSIFTRPPSRAEREAPPRPESRAEPAAPERLRKKRPVEQPPAQPQVLPQQVAGLDAEAQARALAKAERRRRRELQAAEAARSAEALTRAPSKRGKERGEEEMPVKKRRGEGEDGEPRRRKHREVQPSQVAAMQVVPPVHKSAVVGGAPSRLQDDMQQGVPHYLESSANAEAGNVGTTRGNARMQNAKGCQITSESDPPSEGDKVTLSENLSSRPRTPEKAARPEAAERREHHGVRPLAICKTPADNPPVDADVGAADGASVIPLLPSRPAVPETPAPIRQAMVSRGNQVPATPISKLMAVIQRGFEADREAIAEEDEGDRLQDPQALPASSSAPVAMEKRVMRGEDHRRHRSHEVKVKAEDEDVNPFFIDTRPRKHKPETSKARGHNAHRDHNEARVPFMPKAEN